MPPARLPGPNPRPALPFVSPVRSVSISGPFDETAFGDSRDRFEGACAVHTTAAFTTAVGTEGSESGRVNSLILHFLGQGRESTAVSEQDKPGFKGRCLSLGKPRMSLDVTSLIENAYVTGVVKFKVRKWR